MIYCNKDIIILKMPCYCLIMDKKRSKQAVDLFASCLSAVKGIRTPMVSHTDLNRARLPIPP